MAGPAVNTDTQAITLNSFARFIVLLVMVFNGGSVPLARNPTNYFTENAFEMSIGIFGIFSA